MLAKQESKYFYSSRVPIVQPDFTCLLERRRRKRQDEFDMFDDILENEENDTESDPSVGASYPKPYCNCVESK